MKLSVNNAQEICRVVRKNFPYESPWLQSNIEYKAFLNEKNSVSKKKLMKIQNCMNKKNEDINSLRESYIHFSDSPFKYFKELFSGVHNFKVQNCGELAKITYAVLRMNGVKNSDLDIALLTATNKVETEKKQFFINKIAEFIEEIENGNGLKLLDHTVNQVKTSNRKSIVIDALLNECDIKDVVEKLYKTKYGDILNLSEDEKVRIIKDGYGYSILPRLNDEDAKELSNVYPELILNINERNNGIKFNIFNRHIKEKME